MRVFQILSAGNKAHPPRVGPEVDLATMGIKRAGPDAESPGWGNSRRSRMKIKAVTNRMAILRNFMILF